MYPLIEAFYSGHMTVSELHEIYYEQCGNKNGIPVVFVHDGPGAGICIDDRRYFDPSAYHIILFDQRGAGKSIPAYTLEDNDTWSLVSDMERLRKFLGVSRWIVFGVGWGSGLSLAYAEKYTSCVLALVLCGIFTMRDEEIKWYHQEGASHLFPDSWDKYLAPIPEDERGNLIAAYYKRLTGYNEEQQQLCAKGWSRWTMSTKSLKEDIFMPFSKQRVWALHMATLESHYYINKCFVAPNQILNNADVIRNAKIPVTIVQGRYDVVFPAKNAWDLFKKLPEADFFFVENIGHCTENDEIKRKLVQACDKYKRIIPKP